MLHWFRRKKTTIPTVKDERDALRIENVALKAEVETLKAKCHRLRVKVVKVTKEGRP